MAGLKMLSRRELSEAQIRQRLARREDQAAEVDAAVARLKENRSLDDARVAGAIARTETGIRKRGRLRVRRQIEAAGISPALAQRTVDDLFETLDPDALLEAALQKRLRGRDPDRGPAASTHACSATSLVQGFESDRIRQALGRLKPATRGWSG